VCQLCAGGFDGHGAGVDMEVVMMTMMMMMLMMMIASCI
jgi:hypothetical protein